MDNKDNIKLMTGQELYNKRHCKKNENIKIISDIIKDCNLKAVFIIDQNFINSGILSVTSKDSSVIHDEEKDWMNITISKAKILRVDKPMSIMVNRIDAKTLLLINESGCIYMRLLFHSDIQLNKYGI